MERVWDKGPVPMNSFIYKIIGLPPPVVIISESSMCTLPLIGS